MIDVLATLFILRSVPDHIIGDLSFCQAIRTGNTIYMMGQVSWDLDGKSIPNEPGAQADQAMSNINACSGMQQSPDLDGPPALAGYDACLSFLRPTFFGVNCLAIYWNRSQGVPSRSAGPSG